MTTAEGAAAEAQTQKLTLELLAVAVGYPRLIVLEALLSAVASFAATSGKDAAPGAPTEGQVIGYAIEILERAYPNARRSIPRSGK